MGSKANVQRPDRARRSSAVPMKHHRPATHSPPTALCCETPPHVGHPHGRKRRRGGTLTWLSLNLKWPWNFWIAWVCLKEKKKKNDGFHQRWRRSYQKKGGKFWWFSPAYVTRETCSLPGKRPKAEFLAMGHGLTSVSGLCPEGREVTVQRRKWAPETSSVIITTFSKLTSLQGRLWDPVLQAGQLKLRVVKQPPQICCWGIELECGPSSSTPWTWSLFIPSLSYFSVWNA